MNKYLLIILLIFIAPLCFADMPDYTFSQTEWRDVDIYNLNNMLYYIYNKKQNTDFTLLLNTPNSTSLYNNQLSLYNSGNIYRLYSKINGSLKYITFNIESTTNTFTGQNTFTNSLSISTVTIIGTLNLNALSLTVTGFVLMDISSLTVQGKSTFKQLVNVSTSVYVSGSLDVNGYSRFNKSLTLSQGLSVTTMTVTSKSNFGQMVTISTSASVSGNSIFSGNNTFSGTNNFTGLNTFTKKVAVSTITITNYGYTWYIGSYYPNWLSIFNQNLVNIIDIKNTGDVWFYNDVSAVTYTDRTPYPETTIQAYNAVNSMQKGSDGVDHSKLHEFIKSKNGERNLSATVSAQNEVIKDLISRIEKLENK